jgi:hypothetical protein
MPYFHATRRSRLPSIEKHGLKAGFEQNFPCVPGVYLSTDADIAIYFLIEKLEEILNGEDVPDLSPREMIEDMIIIVIDDSRIDRAKLKPDPQIDTYQGTFWFYDGVIDITNLAIVSIGDMAPKG